MKMKKAISLAVAASLAAVTAVSFTGCEWFSSKKKDAVNSFEVATDLGYTPSTGSWLASSGENEHSEAYRMYLEARASGYTGTFMDFLKEINYGDSTSVVANALKSSVTVRAGNGLGSGVIYEAKNGGYYIATNYHVVCNDTTHSVWNSIYVTPYGESSAVSATYVGGVVENDIAVLYAEMSSSAVRPIVSRESDPVVGENIYAVGNTLGEGISVLSGIVSVAAEEIQMARADGKSGSVVMTVTRIDAGVNHGNSGGGLFDRNGHLIGLVNGGKDISVNGSDTVPVPGFGYAIPYSVVSSCVQNIIAQYETAIASDLAADAYCNGALVARLGELETVASSASLGEDGLVYITESVRLSSVDGQSPFSSEAEGAVITKVTVCNQNGVQLYSKVIRRKHEMAAVLMNVRKNNRVVLTLSNGSTLSADYTENSHFKLYK